MFPSLPRLTLSRILTPTLTVIAVLMAVLTAGTAVPAFAEDDAQDSAVKLAPAEWKDVRTLVDQHKGRVVVVDIWSTSCLPCMKEYPNLIQLKKTYGDRIACVSFNVDYAGIRSRPPEHYRERVETFLKKQKSTIPNLMCTKAADELFKELDLNSIPAVYVFDRDGKQVKRFDSSLLEDGEDEAFTYEDDINPFVASLLKSQ